MVTDSSGDEMVSTMVMMETGVVVLTGMAGAVETVVGGDDLG